MTGRFRSGTTILWQVLRDAPDVHAYFEPLHDNLLGHLDAGAPPDPTHVGVEDYFAEYAGLERKLARSHRAEFGVARLCLAAREAHAPLERYLGRLVDHAAPKRALFKLVRADFRLPWLRAKFPDARIVSIHRNPRDQWASAVRLEPAKRRDRLDANTGHDLLVWAAELAPSLPAIARPRFDHSYEVAYLLSCVSHAVASRHADHVISFDDDLQAHPGPTLRRLFDTIGLADPPSAAQIARVVPSARDATAALGDDVPFEEIEAHCDEVLEESGLLEAIAEGALEGRRWPVARDESRNALTRPLANVVSDHRAVLLTLERELRNARLEGERLRAGHAAAIAHVEAAEAARAVAERAEAAQRDRVERLRTNATTELEHHRRQLDEALAHAGGLERELAKRDEAGRGLTQELEKLRRDATTEIEARQQALDAAQEHADHVSSELAKVSEDGRQEIERLGVMLDERDRYARSLVTAIEQLRATSQKEIDARDEGRERAEVYARSLEGEVERHLAEESGLRADLESERTAFERERSRWQALHEATHRLMVRERHEAEARAEQDRQDFQKWIRAVIDDQRAGEESAREEIAAREADIEQGRVFVRSLEEELARREETARALQVENERVQRDADEQVAALDAEISGLRDYSASLETETRKLAKDAAQHLDEQQALFRDLERFTESLKVENVRIRESAREQSLDWARRLDDAHDQLQAAIEAGKMKNKIRARLAKIVRSVLPGWRRS